MPVIKISTVPSQNGQEASLRLVMLLPTKRENQGNEIINTTIPINTAKRLIKKDSV